MPEEQPVAAGQVVLVKKIVMKDGGTVGGPPAILFAIILAVLNQLELVGINPRDRLLPPPPVDTHNSSSIRLTLRTIRHNNNRRGN